MAGAIDFRQTVPILRFYDEAATLAFYRDWLGFALDWQHRFDAGAPLYMQVSRARLVLHLSGHHGDATPGSAVFVAMSGVEALHAELSARPYRFARPGLETASWGARTLTVLDPAGNRLFFNDYGTDG